MPVRWGWKSVVSIASGITAVAAALTVFGVKEVPRPAWSTELHLVADQVLELDSRLTSQQLDDTKLRLYQNRREQRAADRQDHQIPLWMLQEQTDLERIIDNLERRLDSLTGDGQ